MGIVQTQRERRRRSSPAGAAAHRLRAPDARRPSPHHLRVGAAVLVPRRARVVRVVVVLPLRHPRPHRLRRAHRVARPRLVRPVLARPQVREPARATLPLVPRHPARRGRQLRAPLERRHPNGRPSLVVRGQELIRQAGCWQRRRRRGKWGSLEQPPAGDFEASSYG